MVWRKLQAGDHHLGPRGGKKVAGRPRWVGPGRVVFCEAIPHQEADDQRQHIVWVLVGKKLLRCSIHSIRPVSPAERITHELGSGEDPTRWKILSDLIPAREYVDITNEIPGEDELEVPDLPEQPDTTTVAPVRRVTGKQVLQPGNVKRVLKNQSDPSTTHRTSPIGQLREPPVPQHWVATQSAEGAVNDYEIPMDDYLPTSDEGERADPGQTSELHEPDEVSPPDLKRAKLDSRDSYDLKWLEKLESELSQTMDLHTALEDAMENRMEAMSIEIDLYMTSARQRKMFVQNPAAYMVKKMNNAEVTLKHLSNADKELFNRAKAKQVASFIKNAAVRRCLDDAELRQAFDSKRIVQARWVLTWKNIPPEERDEVLDEIRAKPDSTTARPDASKKAKARIVLLGFQHPSLLEPQFKTSAPVISSLGRHLIYLVSVMNQWELEGLDLATAFLQTQPTEADSELWTSGVKELREALGMSEDEVMRILKNVYGSTTAPRGLWLSLNKTLGEHGATVAKGEMSVDMALADREGLQRQVP